MREKKPRNPLNNKPKLKQRLPTQMPRNLVTTQHKIPQQRQKRRERPENKKVRRRRVRPPRERVPSRRRQQRLPTRVPSRNKLLTLGCRYPQTFYMCHSNKVNLLHHQRHYHQLHLSSTGNRKIDQNKGSLGFSPGDVHNVVFVLHCE